MTIRQHEAGAIHQKLITIIQRRMRIDTRTTVCETFRNGWRSSQKISKIHKCLHPHTFLMTQIRKRPTKVAPRTHSIYTHFPKDRNCEVCLRTKMTRAPCRRRTGEAIPQAEKFGDLITTDHKVRYAVVVKVLATQWIETYPCKTKTSQETDKSSRKFFTRKLCRQCTSWRRWPSDDQANNTLVRERIWIGQISFSHSSRIWRSVARNCCYFPRPASFQTKTSIWVYAKRFRCERVLLQPNHTHEARR